MPRWNLRRADWAHFTEVIEKTVSRIPVSIENYDRFTKLIYVAAKRSMPRGHRKSYIPCWSKECSDLLKEYRNSHSDETANQLMQKLDEERRSRWVAAMESMDFTHSSRKSWNLLRRLGAAKVSTTHATVSPDVIADTICEVSDINVPHRDLLHMKRHLRRELRRCTERSGFVSPVNYSEVLAAIKNIKLGRAAGVDGILPEFIRHLGPKAIHWLTNLFTIVMEKSRTPVVWKRAKVVAILKPGKEPSDPKSYRPISLLSVIYKLFERVLLSRIIGRVEESLPQEQAGFREGRSCEEQVLSITTYIEHGFERKLKSGAVFLDLSSAYDTVHTVTQCTAAKTYTGIEM
ncbi:uncharacterized protein LOC120351099 [Nilaparvata lugens]|uniref:uncharacterized protein LOC120351099 n=1 Tax=Nilaparvata lugens TaxID=108931 RepID=UPI00193DB050|nr:uncharacterized protein LOC120351099 [Nilaparvata lugens]